MKRYLAFSILLLCLLKFPWQLSSFTVPEKSNFISNPSANNPSFVAAAFSAQQVTPTVVPPTQKPAKTPHTNPTHTPRPTAPPPEIPPPTDRRLLDSMILFGVIACLTIVFGLWINRQRINPR
jgi:hypothetical protein